MRLLLPVYLPPTVLIIYTELRQQCTINLWPAKELVLYLSDSLVHVSSTCLSKWNTPHMLPPSTPHRRITGQREYNLMALHGKRMGGDSLTNTEKHSFVIGLHQFLLHSAMRRYHSLCPYPCVIFCLSVPVAILNSRPVNRCYHVGI